MMNLAMENEELQQWAMLIPAYRELWVKESRIGEYLKKNLVRINDITYDSTLGKMLMDSIQHSSDVIDRLKNNSPHGSESPLEKKMLKWDRDLLDSEEWKKCSNDNQPKGACTLEMTKSALKFPVAKLYKVSPRKLEL